MTTMRTKRLRRRLCLVLPWITVTLIVFVGWWVDHVQMQKLKAELLRIKSEQGRRTGLVQGSADELERRGIWMKDQMHWKEQLLELNPNLKHPGPRQQ